jgi:hypothetical protein
MTAVVYKVRLEPRVSVVRIERGARLLHVHEQDGSPCVWYECDPKAPLVNRVLRAVPTGDPVFPPEVYVGTAHLVEDRMRLTFHVYDGGEKA